jgi:hypothetical protein
MDGLRELAIRLAMLCSRWRRFNAFLNPNTLALLQAVVGFSAGHVAATKIR